MRKPCLDPGQLIDHELFALYRALCLGDKDRSTMNCLVIQIDVVVACTLRIASKIAVLHPALVIVADI